MIRDWISTADLKFDPQSRFRRRICQHDIRSRRVAENGREFRGENGNFYLALPSQRLMENKLTLEERS